MVRWAKQGGGLPERPGPLDPGGRKGAEGGSRYGKLSARLLCLDATTYVGSQEIQQANGCVLLPMGIVEMGNSLAVAIGLGVRFGKEDGGAFTGWRRWWLDGLVCPWPGSSDIQEVEVPVRFGPSEVDDGSSGSRLCRLPTSCAPTWHRVFHA